MSGEKKPAPNPFAWVFRASVLLLGAVIALNVAITLLRPILPWLIAGFALAATVWIAAAVVRWRRSRW
ncbi:hypothetical protein [Actinomadura formosensis]|uniref:hypothetical protein n=1 Tax=Actinomadura formosensis TaxID=60706 RepID=UPI00083095E3|nr:hypothetical protein [Actinomadura formosensis]